MQINWNTELALSEAIKYETHADMAEHNESLYNWLRSNNLSWVIGGHKEYVGDYAKYLKIAKSMHSIEELNNKYPKILYWAKHNGYYEEFIGFIGIKFATKNEVLNLLPKKLINANVRDGDWDADSAMQEALKYDFVSDMRTNNKGLYDWLNKNNLGWVIGAHKDHASCYPAFTKVARKTETLAKLKKQRPNILYWAKHNGYYDELVAMVGLDFNKRDYWDKIEGWEWVEDLTLPHKGYNRPIYRQGLEVNNSDNDAIYFAKINNVLHNNKQVYKVGVTSERRGKERINELKQAWSWKSGIEVIFFAKTKKNASDLESQILSIGQIADVGKFDGSTEYRALSESDLADVIKIAVSQIEKNL